MKSLRSVACTALALAFGLPLLGNAASLTYTLDRANTLPDGAGYVQVTLADGDDGAIDFTVQLMPELDSFLSEGAGLRSFSFNVAPGTDTFWKNITGLPEGWRSKRGNRTAFGIFDIQVKGKPAAVTDVLRFSIDDIEGDTLEDYVNMSFGPGKEGHGLFAAKVVGMDLRANGRDNGSATFAASTSAVPLPATAWLLGSAFGAIAGFARRCRRG